MIQKLIEKIAIALDKKNIPFMITGGQAVLVYGEPRLTRDIDITLGVDTDRLDNVLDVGQELKFEILVKDIENFVRKTMVLPLIDTETGFRVDFIFSYSPYERVAIKRAKRIKFGNHPVSFASPEDIVIHKLISGRPRDLEDIKGMLLKNISLDKDYLYYWLKQFQDTLQKPLIQEFERIYDEIT